MDQFNTTAAVAAVVICATLATIAPLSYALALMLMVAYAILRPLVADWFARRRLRRESRKRMAALDRWMAEARRWRAENRCWMVENRRRMAALKAEMDAELAERKGN